MLIGDRRRVMQWGLAFVTPAGYASSLSELVAAAKPSVCAVGTFSALDSPRFGFRGTGFFVGDGSLVATCWHVLPDQSAGLNSGLFAHSIQTTRMDGTLEVQEATLVAADRQHDLAVLRVKGRRGQAVPLAAAGSGREGADVALIGFPIGGTLGFRHVTHRGILASIVASALPAPSSRQLNQGAVSRLREGSFELLQLDATAYPGNSGGPLFDIESRSVIGVVNMVLVKSNRESALSQPTGITYAVPIRYLHDLLGKT